MDYVHLQGAIKERTLANMEKYIKKEPKLPLLLNHLRSHVHLSHHRPIVSYNLKWRLISENERIE